MSCPVYRQLSIEWPASSTTSSDPESRPSSTSVSAEATSGRPWLPRHSRALLNVGSRVAPSKGQRGDVLVLQRDPKTYEAEQRAQLEALAAEEQRTGSVPAHGPAIHPMHVAIALSEDEVLHASRDAMRVAREPLASLRQRYRVLGVRRLGPTTVSDEGARLDVVVDVSEVPRDPG